MYSCRNIKLLHHRFTHPILCLKCGNKTQNKKKDQIKEDIYIYFLIHRKQTVEEEQQQLLNNSFSIPMNGLTQANLPLVASKSDSFIFIQMRTLSRPLSLP